MKLPTDFLPEKDLEEKIEQVIRKPEYENEEYIKELGLHADKIARFKGNGSMKIGVSRTEWYRHGDWLEIISFGTDKDCVTERPHASVTVKVEDKVVLYLIKPRDEPLTIDTYIAGAWENDIKRLYQEMQDELAKRRSRSEDEPYY